MKDFDKIFTQITEETEKSINELFLPIPPLSIYEPFHYAITAGGKRIRPFLTLIAAGAISGKPYLAMDAAIAIEVLHNFTLVHDDIMDESPFRRGKPTVYKKWNEPVAILTGDVMVGWAYKLLNNYSSHPRYAEIIKSFTDGLIEVCEGQAYDMDFNTMQDVSEEDYINMIDKKTAKILQTCSILGGLVGDCSNDELKALSDYAYNLGIAFQLQDDLLDISAEQEKLGKKIGQDILEGKKTFLIINAKLKATEPEDVKLIEEFYQNHGLSEDYIPSMRHVFRKYGILEQTAQKAEDYLQLAIKSLSGIKEGLYKDLLIRLIEKMNKRNY